VNKSESTNSVDEVGNDGPIAPNVTPDYVEYYHADEVVDLRQVVRVFIRWGWLVVLLAAIGAAKGVNDLHNFSPVSIARMVVSPVDAENGRGGGGGSGSTTLQAVFSGLKINESGKGSKFDEVMFLTKTQTFAKLMDEKYDLLHRIFRGSWDDASQAWRMPSGREFEFWQGVNGYLNLRVWAEPTVEDLAKYLGGSFDSKLMDDTSYFEITVKNGDADFALWLLKTVFSEAIENLRRQEKVNTQIRREFVLDRLKQTKVVEFRGQLLQTLANLDRKDMLSTGGLPFAAKIMEPPYISKYKTQPNAVKLVGVPAFILGLLGAVMIVLVTLYRGENRAR
jgi:hypothetical protein